MKAIILCCCACLCVVLFGNDMYAQHKPQIMPSRRPEHNMPNLKPDTSPFNMPNLKGISAFSTNPETGEPHYYIDPATGLYFNFDQQEIRNFKTGKVYSFKELEKILREQGATQKDTVPKGKTI